MAGISYIKDLNGAVGNGLSMDVSKPYVREASNTNDLGIGSKTGTVLYSYIGSANVTSSISSLNTLTKSLPIAGAIVTEEKADTWRVASDTKFITSDSSGAPVLSSTTSSPFAVNTEKLAYVPFQGVGTGKHTAANQKYMVNVSATPDILLSTKPVYTQAMNGSSVDTHKVLGAERYSVESNLIRLIPGQTIVVRAVPGLNWGTADLSDVAVGAMVAVDGAGRMFIDKGTTKGDNWIGMVTKVAFTAAAQGFTVASGTGNNPPTSGYTATGTKTLQFELEVRF